MNTQKTFENIEADLLKITQTAKELVSLNQEVLNWKENNEKWSILECLEHLNRYCSYYNKEIKKGISTTPTLPQENIKLSWFAKKSLEAVSSEKVKPSKTLKRMNPFESKLDVSTIDLFIENQEELLGLLQQAENRNVNKKKIRVEFFKLIKLSLAEIFLFMNEHQKRHMIQALKVKSKFMELAATEI